MVAEDLPPVVSLLHLGSFVVLLSLQSHKQLLDQIFSPVKKAPQAFTYRTARLNTAQSSLSLYQS